MRERRWRKGGGLLLCFLLCLAALAAAACGGDSGGTPTPGAGSVGAGGGSGGGSETGAPRLEAREAATRELLGQLTNDLARQLWRGDSLPEERWSPAARETARRLGEELRQGSMPRRLVMNTEAPLIRQEEDWAWMRLHASFDLDGRREERVLDLALRWRDGAWQVEELFVGATETGR